MATDEAKVRLEIFDPVGAPPFDLTAYATAQSEVDPMAESGRGLGLILRCADGVHYGLSGNRRRLALDFHR